MKKSLYLFILLSTLLFPLSNALAVHVNGYYRSNGTYVNSYERTSPDGNPYNNYSYPGNYNPNTGNITGGSATTYLNNYYNKSSSSYYSPSYYSSTSIPTCPTNSYYDGISSCKCNYGYVNSGGSCVSGNNICYSQTGYASSYNPSSNTCKCNAGYVLNSAGKCITGDNFCSIQYGYESWYNSISNTCQCYAGYVLSNAGQCVSSYGR